jgi:low affinity Fe/Cu permease
MITMNHIYRNTERGFEKLSSVGIAILGNSIAFILAVCVVIFWLFNRDFHKEPINDTIRDGIFGFTFLSMFIIQKSFNRFSAALHIKINELVVSHEPASNTVINVEEKTEHEISQLAKEYSGRVEGSKENDAKS